MANLNMDVNPLPSTPGPDTALEGDFVPQRRPFGVTLLLWLVLILSAWGLLRFAGALRWWDLLVEKKAHLGPLYLSITGAGWALAGIVLVWSILSTKRWAHLAVLIFTSAWLIEYWFERLFFQSARSNIPFAIVATLFILAITAISALNRKTKSYLIKSEEYEQPKEHSTSA